MDVVPAVKASGNLSRKLLKIRVSAVTASDRVFFSNSSTEETWCGKLVGSQLPQIKYSPESIQGVVKKMVCRMNGRLWYAVLNENDRERNLNVNRNDLDDIWNAHYRAAVVSHFLLQSPSLTLGIFLGLNNVNKS